MSPSGRRALVAGFCLFAAGCAAAVGYAFWRVGETVHDAYAVWHAADLVVEHMEGHGGAWPQSWDDLCGTYESRATPGSGPASWEEIRARVEIDFTANPARLAAAESDGAGPPFRVIRLRNGRETHYEGCEPNEIVFRYFAARKQRDAREGGLP